MQIKTKLEQIIDDMIDYCNRDGECLECEYRAICDMCPCLDGEYENRINKSQKLQILRELNSAVFACVKE